MLRKTRPNPFSSRMRRAATAESILITFCTSTTWADVVMYLKRHPNWSKGLRGVEVRNFAYHIDFTILASNTAYCATVHTRARPHLHTYSMYVCMYVRKIDVRADNLTA